MPLREGAAQAVEALLREAPVSPRLTPRRFFGLDRSGPPPPETLPGAPLRPWTIPNAIGYVRLALIPVFLWLAWEDDGVGAAPAAVYAVVALGDYADGIAARVTGQYSRLGAMLDPVVDRLLDHRGRRRLLELRARAALAAGDPHRARGADADRRPARAAPGRRAADELVGALGRVARDGRALPGALRTAR